MKKLIFAIATAVLLGTFIYLNSCSSTLQVAPIRSTSDLKNKNINLPEEAVLRIGYSTVLIKSKDSYVLIDPWFSEKAAYYHGKDSLAMSVNQLPNLTAILTSQDHYDHFDIETLSTYPNKNVPFFVCSGSKQKDKALKFNFTNVIEPENFETISLGNIKITSFEGRSNEKPSSFDYERNYIIETANMTYLFVGHMMQKSVQEAVAKRYPKIDLAFLPVNDLRIKINFNEQKAFGPENAANLCMLLRPRTAVPVHYNFEGSWLSNTFLLRQNGTPEKFKQKIQEKKINTVVQILETGNWLSLK